MKLFKFEKSFRANCFNCFRLGFKGAFGLTVLDLGYRIFSVCKVTVLGLRLLFRVIFGRPSRPSKHSKE